MSNFIFKGQKQVVKILLDLDCNEKITNIYGQKALYWIIAKCPELVLIYFVI